MGHHWGWDCNKVLMGTYSRGVLIRYATMLSEIERRRIVVYVFQEIQGTYVSSHVALFPRCTHVHNTWCRFLDEPFEFRERGTSSGEYPTVGLWVAQRWRFFQSSLWCSVAVTVYTQALADLFALACRQTMDVISVRYSCSCLPVHTSS